MEELQSGDHVGVGTNGSGGILISVWDHHEPYTGSEGRALLTTLETEWLIEKLDEALKLAGLEKHGRNEV